jgi:hypothetical protein
VFLFADEAFFAGDKKHESILKALITEPTLTVEAKGIDAEPAPNFLHIGVASNEDWVIPASGDERRYFVLQAADVRAQDTAYFAELKRQLDAGGLENLLHYLMRRDLVNFEVRHVPRSSALSDQKALSQRPEESWWYHKLVEGRWLSNHEGYRPDVIKDELYQDYIDEMVRQGVQRRLSRIALGRFIAKASPRGFPRSEQHYVHMSTRSSQGEGYERKIRPWFYIFSDLAEQRKSFEDAMGRIDEWPEEDHPNPLGDEAANTPF